MKILVDLDLCQGHGVCESEAPTVFKLAKEGQVRLLNESPGPELRAAVEQAVTFCPTGALRIEEGSEGTA